MDTTSIEDLLFETLDAISRFRVGQRESVAAALDAGALLTEAKGRLRHGEWGDWLGFAIILFLLFQFVETRPVFTMPRPEVSRSLRVNYLPGFPDLSP